jgi:hypothetical protein
MAVKDKVGDMELLLEIYVGGDIKNTTHYCAVVRGQSSNSSKVWFKYYY